MSFSYKFISLTTPETRAFILIPATATSQPTPESQEHKEAQAQQFQQLDPEKCKANVHSKLSPYELRTLQLDHVNPCYGNTLIEEYTNTSLNEKMLILALGVCRAGQITASRYHLQNSP